MELKLAREKLDHVLKKGKVEMYKPIQVAEILRELKTNKSIDPLDLETYRKLSRDLRDKVTLELIGKNSISSMRYQDDLWNDSAIPPEALESLSAANSESKVEEYIYQHIYVKNLQMINIRKVLDDINSIAEIESIFISFNSPGLRTSAERLFEVFTLSVLQSQIDKSDFIFSISGNHKTLIGSTGKSVLSIVESQKNRLELAKMGHTNAADAGLDIWTNFGVVISVKNYTLDEDLLNQVLVDTPNGLLVIVCESLSSKLNINSIAKFTDRPIVIITKQELFNDAEILLQQQDTCKKFIDKLKMYYDREFPLSVKLESFMERRKYNLSEPDETAWA